MSGHIFISYAQRDSERAHEICRSLESTGIRCWIAPRDITPGSEWSSCLVTAIKTSAAIIVVLSAESNRSAHVAREVALASERRIPLIPVVIETVHVTDSMSYLLGGTQWIDLTQQAVAEGLRFVAHAVAALVPPSAIQTVTAPQVAPTPATKGYVFLSYNREDHDFVVRLRAILKRRGYAYWDYSESERDYHSALYRELEEKIENASAFMCVVTDSWRESEWPAAEYLYAREAKIPVFVIQAKPLARPVPIILNQQTRIDMASDFAKGSIILEHELDKKKL